MAGDYTRMTFTSAKDHSGVLMQQGRVTLDADWNELVDATDHRLRSEIVDTLGRCVFSRETPDAFLISLSGGALTIGRGRAYVDGILAECHGAGVAAFDPVLADDFGVDPVDYLKQPYDPNPDPLPATGTHVAYLDVWKREVTALQDPDLVEKAIGIDTATRIQNAWQVRLLEGTGDMDCDTQLATWDALTAPSAGRLTTTAVGVPVSTDPCTIPPSGGYRGTENRLYRVEIHDAGLLGTATFKWSRDNASIASHVEAIDTARTTLTVTRLGRDDVRRLRVDDWVEVTDDWRELHGLPGELRKVATVDEVNETLTFATALPAGEFNATDPARHTRVIRWDQAGAAVDAAGGVVTGSGRGRNGDRPRGRRPGQLRHRSGRRELPRRRLLGLRRPHGRRLGRAAGGRAAAWRHAPLLPARHRDLPRRPGDRLPPSARGGLLRLRVRRLRHAGVARERCVDDPDGRRPGREDRREDLPPGRSLPPGAARPDPWRALDRARRQGLEDDPPLTGRLPAIVVEVSSA